MYKLDFHQSFKTHYEKLTDKKPLLKKQIKKALTLLAENPRHPTLKTHKVQSRNHGELRSSWVTGDIRIIWKFVKMAENEEPRIRIFDIGSHTGQTRVYN